MSNVYQMVTDRIIEQLRSGLIPWHKPWFGSSNAAISFVSRKPYSLLNQMLLGDPGEYLTFNQVKQLGGSLKKGAKGRIVVFYKILEVESPLSEQSDRSEQKTKKRIPLLRYYRVFNINDTEGVETKTKPTPTVINEPIEAACAVVADYVHRSGVKIEIRQSDRAYYSPVSDTVVCPLLSQFESAAHHYSVLFHELTHSTLTAERCDRTKENAEAFFGNEDYSKEELVAEMGSAMIANQVGFDSEQVFTNSVAYIQNWLSVLKSDPRFIVAAAGKAEKAANYILGVA